MNLHEIKAYLEKASASGIRPGLDRMRELMGRLGDPQDQYPVIHVAGTNGKGSTSAYMVSILLCAGLKVGWYSSPAVVDDREIIRIMDGSTYDFSAGDPDVFDKAMDEGYLQDETYEQIMTDIIETVEMMSSKNSEKPTVYELETAGAFAAFEQEKVDVAVVEVGMGGKNDATNVIRNSLLSVITPIGLDHMQYLGSSVSLIAGEKAGIIPERGRVVTYQPGVRMGVPMGAREAADGDISPIKQREIARTKKRQERMRGMIVGRIRVEAEDKNADFTEVHGESVVIDKYDLSGIDFKIDGASFRTRMIGEYQVYNAMLAVKSIEKLEQLIRDSEDGLAGVSDTWDASGLSDKILNAVDGYKETGISIAKIPARFDVISEDPIVIYDGAHNPDGVFVLAESIGRVLKDKKIYGVMGVFRDKAAEDMAKTVVPFMSKITTVRAPGERGMEAEPLAAIISGAVPEVPVVSGGSDIEAVVREVTDEAKKEDAVVLIFGSLSMAKTVYHM